MLQEGRSSPFRGMPCSKNGCGVGEFGSWTQQEKHLILLIMYAGATSTEEVVNG